MHGPGLSYKGGRISRMQLAIMMALYERSTYGYDLLKFLREHFEGSWEPQTGAIYPALRRLQEHGLLLSEIQGEREHYRLSAEGEAWLRDAVGRMGRGASFGLRFTALLMETHGRMGLPPAGPHPCGDEGLENRLRKYKERLEAELENVEDALRRLEEESE